MAIPLDASGRARLKSNQEVRGEPARTHNPEHAIHTTESRTLSSNAEFKI
jgi:hypothetical protein